MISTKHLAAFAAFLACAAGSAQAQEFLRYGEARGWMVDAIVADTFVGCEAQRIDREGTLALGRVDTGYYLAVGADIPDDLYEGYANVDAYEDAVTWNAYDGRISADVFPVWISSFMRGSDLQVIVSDGRPMYFSLTGTTAAVNLLDECYDNRGRRSGVRSGAAAPAPAPTVAVESDAARLGEGCPAPGEVTSAPSDVPIRVTFTNHTDRAVSIYWADFDGQLVEYAGTLPGEAVEIDTYEGHAWIAKDFDATCYGFAFYPTLDWTDLGIWP